MDGLEEALQGPGKAGGVCCLEPDFDGVEWVAHCVEISLSAHVCVCVCVFLLLVTGGRRVCRQTGRGLLPYQDSGTWC